MSADMQRDSRAVDLLKILPDISHKTRAGERRRIVADVLTIHHPEHMFGRALDFVRALGRTQQAQQCAEDELARRKASLRGAAKLDRRVRAAGLCGLGGLWGVTGPAERHPRLISAPMIDALGDIRFLRSAGAEWYLPETRARREAYAWSRINNMMAAYDRHLATVEERCADLGMSPGMYLEVRDNLGDPDQMERMWEVLAAKGVARARSYHRRDPAELPVAAGKEVPPAITIDSILGELEDKLPEARAVFAERTREHDLSCFAEQERLIAAGAPHAAAIAERRLRRWVAAVVGLGEFSRTDRALLGGGLVDGVDEAIQKAARKAAADAIALPTRPFSVFNLEP